MQRNVAAVPRVREKSRTDCGALALVGGFRGVFRKGESYQNLRKMDWEEVIILLSQSCRAEGKIQRMPFRGTVGKEKATGLSRCLIFLNKAR